MTPSRPLASGLAVLAMSAAAALPAAAARAVPTPDDTHGPCSGTARWELRAQPDDGLIRVRGEVDDAASGQRWRWRLLHDGAVSARGYARTDGGGGFDVQRYMVDAAGSDRIGWRAHNPRSGQTCRGGLTY